MVSGRPSRWQIRRASRRMRRLGVQPMMNIGQDTQLGAYAIAATARGVWRYRSELAPLAIVAATFLASVILHLTHPTWWPHIVAVTAAAAWLLALFGDRLFGLVHGLERAYAAMIAGLVGGWLAAATALGPLHAPLPALALVGGLVAALPWWAHRRRRAKVRVERTLAAWPEIAQAVGLAGSQVQSAVVDPWGWRARLNLARGQTIEDAITKKPSIESALDTRRGAVRIQPTGDNLARRIELRVIETDPHADAIAWPGPSVTSITQPVELGVFEDATPVAVPVQDRHVLFGGTTGAGKSGGVNGILGNLTACTDVVVWGIDLKGGMELAPWRDCLGRLATNPHDAQALLADAVARLDARARWLTQQGLRSWPPSRRAPALVILIDEYAELVDDAPGAVPLADSIARRGRAVAVTLIIATQRPTTRAMGHSAVRSQMTVRLCFRVRERRDVDLIIGQGALKAGWHAHSLNAPGKFLISAPEHTDPNPARAYLITDHDVQAANRRNATNRPTLDLSPETPRIVTGRTAETPVDTPASQVDHHPQLAAENDAEAILWAALSAAPPEGISISELIEATGMARPTLYRRLAEHLRTGRVVQVGRGRYRASAQGERDPQ